MKFCSVFDAFNDITYYGGFEGEKKWTEAVKESCRIGAAALRELDAQEKKPMCEWISVKDRLPERNNKNIYDTVIVYTIENEVAVGFVDYKGVSLHILHGDSDQITEHKLHFVTHWMPLPEPPKEEHHAE